MGYDIQAVRDRFPALAEGYAHFDAPGGSQVPDVVAAAVSAALLSPLASRGRVTAVQRSTDEIVLADRAAMADLLAATRPGSCSARA